MCAAVPPNTTHPTSSPVILGIVGTAVTLLNTDRTATACAAFGMRQTWVLAFRRPSLSGTSQDGHVQEVTRLELQLL
jgi:hypothetical protein